MVGCEIFCIMIRIESKVLQVTHGMIVLIECLEFKNLLKLFNHHKGVLKDAIASLLVCLFVCLFVFWRRRTW